MTTVACEVRDATANETDLLLGLAAEVGVPAVRGGRMRVAAPGGAVAGFARLDLDRPVAELVALYVFENRRRCGIGRLLVDDARELARAAGCAGVIVLAQPWSELFFRAAGARRWGWQDPCVEVPWSRPRLLLDLDAPR